MNTEKHDVCWIIPLTNQSLVCNEASTIIIRTRFLNFILQLDGALPLYYHLDVRAELQIRLPKQIDRAGLNDDAFLNWPPRPLDVTPCDFFLCGYFNDKVYTPPLQESISRIQQRLTNAINNRSRHSYPSMARA